MVCRLGFQTHLIAALATALSIAGSASTAVGQQVLATPQGDDGAPQTIDDLLGVLAAEEAPADWVETDVRYRPQPDQNRSFAVISALDKTTAVVSPVAVPVGESANFGTLTITVRSCQVASSDRDQNAVFIEVEDDPPGHETDQVFAGWMYSASRAVSAMDHPVYDLWLASCVDEVPRPPEDMARDVVYGLPSNPPLPAPTPSRRL